MIGKIILTIILLALLATSLVLFYYTVSEIKAEHILFIEQNYTLTSNQLSYISELQFYPNMRFPTKEISYTIKPRCNTEKTIRIVRAFKEIENVTGIIKFYETNSDAQIKIVCEKSPEEDIQPGEYFIVGEGGPTLIINASLFNIIEEGKLLLFYEKPKCINSNIEVHEILHVLGFKHSENPRSIMYPISDCTQFLTTDITQEIIRIYSIQELPDLYFHNITAFKHGSYLDFEADIRNQGLSSANEITLSLFKKEDSTITKLKDFEIGDLSYGEGKLLTVKNIKIGRNTETVEFVLNAGKELNNKNNFITLSVSS